MRHPPMPPDGKNPAYAEITEKPALLKRPSIGKL